MTGQSPQQPHQSNGETFELYATVRVVTDMHVRINHTAPHPDMADFDAIAELLGAKIESEGGDVSRLDGVAVDHVTINAEVDHWAPKAAQHG